MVRYFTSTVEDAKYLTREILMVRYYINIY